MCLFFCLYKTVSVQFCQNSLTSMQNTLLMQYTTQCIKMFISNMPCTVIIHIYIICIIANFIIILIYNMNIIFILILMWILICNLYTNVCEIFHVAIYIVIHTYIYIYTHTHNTTCNYTHFTSWIVLSVVYQVHSIKNNTLDCAVLRCSVVSDSHGL